MRYWLWTHFLMKNMMISSEPKRTLSNKYYHRKQIYKYIESYVKSQEKVSIMNEKFVKISVQDGFHVCYLSCYVSLDAFYVYYRKPYVHTVWTNQERRDMRSAEIQQTCERKSWRTWRHGEKGNKAMYTPILISTMAAEGLPPCAQAILLAFRTMFLLPVLIIMHYTILLWVSMPGLMSLILRILYCLIFEQVDVAMSCYHHLLDQWII